MIDRRWLGKPILVGLVYLAVNMASGTLAAAAVSSQMLTFWRLSAFDLGSASGYRPRMLIAFIAWPLLTAVPAFVTALVVAAGLARSGRMSKVA